MSSIGGCRAERCGISANESSLTAPASARQLRLTIKLLSKAGSRYQHGSKRDSYERIHGQANGDDVCQDGDKDENHGRR